MKKILVAALAAYVWSGNARACDESQIDSISGDGSIIVVDGNTYEVTSGDASGWSSCDTVQVCTGRIVDTDQDGESVSVVER